jgi:transcriptional regulator with XRE-family HTH domain
MARATLLIEDLKAWRQTLGWSVKDVSDRCGIDETSLGEWEGGVATPPLDAAERWAEVLGFRFQLVPIESGTRRSLRVDWRERRVTVDNKPVRLTAMEWKAMERLAWAPGELVTHQELFNHIYGNERYYRAQSTAIRVLMTKLRRLLPLQIDARWSKGYVISGVGPSLPHEPVDRVDNRSDMPQSAAMQPRFGPTEPTPDTALSEPARAPLRREEIELSETNMLDLATPPIRSNPRRSEELGIIERFLAERGATRCPDGVTIQQSPLPALVWDKVKRKWVRPAQ